MANMVVMLAYQHHLAIAVIPTAFKADLEPLPSDLLVTPCKIVASVQHTTSVCVAPYILKKAGHSKGLSVLWERSQHAPGGLQIQESITIWLAATGGKYMLSCICCKACILFCLHIASCINA